MSSSYSEIINHIKLEYRHLFLEKVANLKKNVSVVEFYCEGNQYFVDIENKIYEMDDSKSDLHGFCVGYLKDGIIYLE